MDKLTEEIFAMWLQLYNQEDYCMSGVTSPQRHQALKQPPLGHTSKTAL